MTAPLRRGIVRHGQPYVDIAAVFAEENELAAAVRLAFASPAPMPPRLTLAYDRQPLKWVRSPTKRAAIRRSPPG